MCLLRDIALARQISSIVGIAKDKGIAPDEAAFWMKEQQMLEDTCRQRGLPNMFFAVAPAEWTFPHHESMFQKHKDGGALFPRRSARCICITW